MSKETYRWLEKELPSWVDEGIVTQESATVLLRRYEGEKASSRSSGMAFTLLGFVLVGLGIISILAYNWDELGHLERTFLAVFLLVGSQAFAFWVKRYRSNDAALREGSGIFWFLMTGASLAIIAQTYHLGGSMLDFLSVWFLLSLGIAWVLSSSGAAFFQVILWTFVWLGSRSDAGALFDQWREVSFLPSWIQLALALSWALFYAMRHDKAKESNATLLLGWAVALCLLAVFVVEISIEAYAMKSIRVFFNLSALFCAIYYLAGKLSLSYGSKAWQRPFEGIGKWGALVLLLAHVSLPSLKRSMPSLPTHSVWEGGEGMLVTFALIFALLLWVWIRRERRMSAEVLIVASPFIIVAYGMLQSVPFASMLLVNVGIVVGASWMIYCGAKEATVGVINQGMLLIASVIWIHFMDAHFDLVAKGTAFIVTGVLFLAFNALLRRRFKGVS